MSKKKSSKKTNDNFDFVVLKISVVSLVILLIFVMLLMINESSEKTNDEKPIHSSSSYKSTSTSEYKSEVLNEPSGQSCINVYLNDGRLFVRGDNQCPNGERCYTISRDEYHCNPPGEMGYGCEGICK